MNLSILIPTYIDHENVYKLLKYLQKENIKLNRIFVVSDKIEDVNGDIDKIVLSLTYKVKINEMEGVTCINKTFHGGRSGIVNYVHDLDISDDENLIVLEDDLFAEKMFFYHCEVFFNYIHSNERPIFVGYSRANTYKSELFETYNLLHLWGFALKFGDLKAAIAYHDKVRGHTPEQKEEIIRDVLSYKYPCEVFEKYKTQLLERVKKNFLATSKESADLYFMFYFLQNRQTIMKPTQSHIISSKERTSNIIIPNDVEMDLRNSIAAFVD